MHQFERGSIAGVDPGSVSHRQGESGTLQQSTEVTDTSHRGNSRAGTASKQKFGRNQGAAQLCKCIATEKTRDCQPVRFQHIPALDQLADRVI